jgi:FkbM family methyltransferase
LYQVISEAFYADDWHFYEVTQTLVMPGDTVLDCGAAEGLFTMLAARSAEKIFAIEPQPRFVETLRRTFADVSKVAILPYALGATRGVGRIALSGIAASVTDGAGGADSADSAEVEITTIDALFHDGCDRIAYIKADLEGHDLAMLEGAEAIIRRDSPRIAVTTYHRADHASEMIRLLRAIQPAYRFRCKGIYQGTGSPMMLHAWVD